MLWNRLGERERFIGSNEQRVAVDILVRAFRVDYIAESENHRCRIALGES